MTINITFSIFFSLQSIRTISRLDTNIFGNNTNSIQHSNKYYYQVDNLSSHNYCHLKYHRSPYSSNILFFDIESRKRIFFDISYLWISQWNVINLVIFTRFVVQHDWCSDHEDIYPILKWLFFEGSFQSQNESIPL